MYDKTVTVFNFYESTTAAMWYPHVLSGVDLNTDRGSIIKKYGPDSTDSAQLHITYTKKDEQKIITDADGKELSWVPPKEWKRQVNDVLVETITFSAADGDFFIDGAWDGGPVSDEDYRGGFYAYMNNRHDFCYKITSVGGPYTVIPHFEILGA